MKRTFFIVLCLLSVLSLGACAWMGPKEEKPADELAREGIAAFNDGDYRDAIEAFEALKDWYPFSKFAILAELKIADAHYHLQAYDEAIQAYEEFENLHPRNEAIPYVIYQIGRSHFNQIDTVDRDQTATRKALATFNRLQANFPEDPYAVQAGEHIIECHRNLAGHEFYVGVFYYKSKHYKAARQRFNAVLTEHPDVGMHYRALQYLALCEDSLTNEAPPDDTATEVLSGDPVRAGTPMQ